MRNDEPKNIFFFGNIHICNSIQFKFIRRIRTLIRLIGLIGLFVPFVCLWMCFDSRFDFFHLFKATLQVGFRMIWSVFRMSWAHSRSNCCIDWSIFMASISCGRSKLFSCICISVDSNCCSLVQSTRFDEASMAATLFWIDWFCGAAISLANSSSNNCMRLFMPIKYPSSWLPTDHSLMCVMLAPDGNETVFAKSINQMQAWFRSCTNNNELPITSCVWKKSDRCSVARIALSLWIYLGCN